MRVTAKDVQQSGRRRGSARLTEPEPACDVGLKRRTEAVLGATLLVLVGAQLCDWPDCRD